jgi:hypothetical protein
MARRRAVRESLSLTPRMLPSIVVKARAAEDEEKPDGR